MKRILVGFILLLTACSTTQSPMPVMPIISASLPDLGLAPELTNDIWLNVNAPLRLAELRGQVVAIDMWTFG